jgi:sugar lactone lactonase YvrE
MPELSVVADGLGFVEGPRWRNGELWFSDFYNRTVNSVTPSGRVTRRHYIAGQPSGLGFAPDGSLLVVVTHEGHLVRFDAEGPQLVADIGAIYRGWLNDMLVTPEGRAYISCLPAHKAGDRTRGAAHNPSVPLFTVAPDGETSVAAEGLAIPNGIAITADGGTLIVAETLGRKITAFDVGRNGALSGRRVFADCGKRQPDGICIDGDGHIWYGSPFTSEFVLVTDGGKVLEVVESPGRWAVAPALSDDGGTLWGATATLTIEEYFEGQGRGAIEMCKL